MSRDGGGFRQEVMVEGLTTAVALELTPLGIRVVAVNPAIMDGGHTAQ